MAGGGVENELGTRKRDRNPVREREMRDPLGGRPKDPPLEVVGLTRPPRREVRPVVTGVPPGEGPAHAARESQVTSTEVYTIELGPYRPLSATRSRSEERRVGKECRS